MTKQLSTLALMGALVAAATVSLPSEALAQYGHHYRHHYGYGYGHGYYGHGYGYRGHGGYGYGAYGSDDGHVRIVRENDRQIATADEPARPCRRYGTRSDLNTFT